MKLVPEIQQLMQECNEHDVETVVARVEQNYQSEMIASRLRSFDESGYRDLDGDRDTLEALAEAPVIVIPCQPIAGSQFLLPPAQRDPADEEEIYRRSRPFRKVQEESAFHLVVWWNRAGHVQETMLDLFTASAVVACLDYATNRSSTPGMLGRLLTLSPIRLAEFCLRMSTT